MDSGSEIEDISVVAKLIESSGIDLLDISGGLCFPSVKGRIILVIFLTSSKS